MKILRLELKAFGPFTDRVLDLSAGHEGLHIIFGVNEAGKSTALRGLEQLFFGMPERTGDDFLHASLKMRLGATLQHSDGSVLTFWRRRARKTALYAADDMTALDPGKLGRFLGNLDQGLFASMFGFNRATLEKGGQEILSGGGQLGEILFAAASGIAGLRAVQTNLDDDLERLFRPTGKLRKINLAFTELRDARERLKQHQLQGDDWQRHDQALRAAEEHRLELQRQLEHIEQEARRLCRLRDAQPLLEKRRQLLVEVEAVQDAPRLPGDFSPRRRQVKLELDNANRNIQQAERGLAEVDRQLASLEVPHEVLNRAEEIEDLFRRLGEYQKAQRELPERQQQFAAKQAEVQALWQRLGRGSDLAQAAARRPQPEELARVRTLALEHQSLQANLNHGQANVNRLTKFLEQSRHTLDKLPQPIDITELRRTLRQVQAHAPLEDEWNALCQRAEQAEKQSTRLHGELPGFKGTLADLLDLTVPTAETLDRFQETLQELHTRGAELQNRVKTGDKALHDLAEQLRQLEKDRPIPTEADLRKVRDERDSTWQQLRQGRIAGELVATFERQQAEADALADILYREAERVARKSELLAQLEQRQQRQAESTQELEQARSQWQQLQEQWRGQLGAGLPTLSPRELRGWLVRYQGVVQQVQVAREFASRAEALRTRLDQQCHELEACLARMQSTPGPLLRSFSFLLEHAHNVVDDQESLSRRRQDLQRDQAGRKQELELAKAEWQTTRDDLKRWQAAWAPAMVRLGLDAGTQVDPALRYLDTLQDFYSRLQEVDILRTRIESLSHDLDGFSRDVLLIHKGLSTLEAGNVVEMVLALHQRLKKAREIQQRRTGLAENRQRLEAQLHDAQQARNEQESAQTELCRIAGCSSPAGLVQLEERCARRNSIEEELARVDQLLQGLRGSESLEDFSRQVAQIELSRLSNDLAAAEQDQQKLRLALKEADQTIGRERQELSKMDGSAQAAADAEQVEFLQTQIQTDAREYAVRRLALDLLQESIDRFRHKAEGQVVKRASDLFSLLTLHAFDGLNLDTNEDGETVLSGVRAGDRHMVPMEGMSDGTRDQLFLALRLASLEVYLESHEPIPFIVDDLLLNFDDARALAALKALTQLSQRTQVLFFTHHQHLVELARQELPADAVFFHTLSDEKRTTNLHHRPNTAAAELTGELLAGRRPV